MYLNSLYACGRVISVRLVCYCLFVLSFYSGIVCFGQNELYSDVVPNSGLCESEKNATCSHQVAGFNANDGACKMVYKTRGDAACSDENFKGDVDPMYNYGRFIILTYLYRKSFNGSLFHVIPTFNITFSHIKWTSMKMRFKENQSSNVSLCREFQVSPNVIDNFFFYFDCLWLDNSYANRPFLFQYQITTQSSDIYLYKYFFKVPDKDKMDEEKTSISEWEVFSFVDMSDSMNSLTLHVQAVPASFNVSEYKIQVIGFKDEEDFKFALSKMRNISYYDSKSNKEVIRQLWDNTWVLKVEQKTHEPDLPSSNFSYNTRSHPGIYRFTVELVHPECGQQCFVSETPSIVIVDLPARSTLVLFVGAVILIPVCLTLYFIWRRKCETAPPTPDPSLPPKFLLIYTPVSVEHVNSMIEVSKYFNKVCRLQTMIDVIGIPQSEHKDPMKWYIEAFNEADFVGIFASPKSDSSTKDATMKNLIYSDTPSIAQAQLRNRLCSPGAKCKFFCVALPGSCWDTLPGEAQALKRYKLPMDLDPLLVLIGVVPQCDGGKGFMEALNNAHPERDTLVLTLNGNVSNVPGPSAQSSPTPTPVTCCPALSTSDPDLMSTSQQVTSCMSTPNSSDDQLSLLGNY